MKNEDDGKFYICNCFSTDNIFLEDYKLHVRFVSEQQFKQDYGAVRGIFSYINKQHSVEFPG